MYSWIRGLLNKEKVSLICSFIAIVIAIPSFWISLESLNNSRESLNLSRESFDIANNRLVRVEGLLTAIEDRALFLHVEDCIRIWVAGNPEIKFVSCDNGTYMDTCGLDFQESPYSCDNRSWYRELIQSYTWNKTIAKYNNR